MAENFFLLSVPPSARRRARRTLPRTGLSRRARIRKKQRQLEQAEKTATKRFNSLSHIASSLGQTQEGLRSNAYAKTWAWVDFYGRLLDSLNARWNALEDLLSPPDTSRITTPQHRPCKM